MIIDDLDLLFAVKMVLNHEKHEKNVLRVRNNFHSWGWRAILMERYLPTQHKRVAAIHADFTPPVV
jgi:membrane protein DedA with SNARE-associated domain